MAYIIGPTELYVIYNLYAYIVYNMYNSSFCHHHSQKYYLVKDLFDGELKYQMVSQGCKLMEISELIHTRRSYTASMHLDIALLVKGCTAKQIVKRVPNFTL